METYEKDCKFLMDSLSQEDGYLYRGFFGVPDIRPDGSVRFVARWDPLYSDNGISDSPVVSFSPFMDYAAEYAIGQYKCYLKDAEKFSSPQDRDEFIEEVVLSGYSLIKVKRESIPNSFFANGDNDLMFEGDVLVPKGSYEFRNVWEDVMGCLHCEKTLVLKDEKQGYNIDLENECLEKARLAEEEKLAGMIEEYISSGDNRNEQEFRARLHKEFRFVDWKIDKVMQDVNREFSGKNAQVLGTNPVILKP